MTKNMTDAQRAARIAAESEVIPERESGVCLEPPALMRGNPQARRYWDKILERMEGYAILDDLDSETLGIYCVQLSRYEGLCKDLRGVRTKLQKSKDPDAVESALARLDSVTVKLQRLETNLLQYAEKLGLTPTARVRLAQKRADTAAAQADPDGDLFGD